MLFIQLVAVNILIITKFSIYFLSCSDNLYYTLVTGHIQAVVPVVEPSQYPLYPHDPLHMRIYITITLDYSQVIYKDTSGNILILQSKK